MSPKMLMMAVLVILGMKMAIVTDAQATCGQNLLPCSPYFNSPLGRPHADCCNRMREVIAAQPSCLCSRIVRACGVTSNSPCNNGTPRGDNGGAERVALTRITTVILFLVSAALY